MISHVGADDAEHTGGECGQAFTSSRGCFARASGKAGGRATVRTMRSRIREIKEITPVTGLPTSEEIKSSLFSWRDFVIAAIPIGLGSAIYLLFRARSIWIFKIAEAGGMGAAVEYARRFARPLNPYVSGVTLYSLPTALWAFSFIFCVVTIWRVQLKSFSAIFFILLTVSAVLGAELAQAIGIVPGRFDKSDLFANIAGLIFGGTVAYGKGFIKKQQIHGKLARLYGFLPASWWLSRRKC